MQQRFIRHVAKGCIELYARQSRHERESKEAHCGRLGFAAMQDSPADAASGMGWKHEECSDAGRVRGRIQLG